MGDELRFITQNYGITNIFGAGGGSAGVSVVGVLKEIIIIHYNTRDMSHGKVTQDPIWAKALIDVVNGHSCRTATSDSNIGTSM